MEVPQNGWLIRQNPIKTDVFFGYSYFRTPLYNFETRIPNKNQQHVEAVGWRKPNRFRILVVFASISGTISMSL